MRRNQLIAGAVAIAALAGGATGAVAATGDQKAAERTVLADAAKRLGVTADALRGALADAEDAQLDAAVKAGELTQAQADEIRQHREEEGTVIGLGHGGPGDHGGHHGGRMLLADAADAIGVSETSLMTQLRDGKTLTAIAKAHGKTLAEVRTAVKAAATKRLDADLAAGRITQAEHDEEIAELDDEVADLGAFGDHGLRGGPRPSDDALTP